MDINIIREIENIRTIQGTSNLLISGRIVRRRLVAQALNSKVGGGGHLSVRQTMSIGLSLLTSIGYWQLIPLSTVKLRENLEVPLIQTGLEEKFTSKQNNVPNHTVKKIKPFSRFCQINLLE